MSTNLPSLNDLHDIVVPEHVSAWPPAPAVWVLISMALAIGAFFVLRWLIRYRREAYRRAALAELERAPDLTAVAGILRRTALAVGPREEVVSQHGAAWCDWLARTSGCPVPDAARAALDAVYSGAGDDPEALRSYATEWITGHAAGGTDDA